MKKYLLVFAVMGLFAASCTKMESPEFVAEQFFNAFLAQDYDEMEKYASKKLIPELEKERLESNDEISAEKKEVFDEMKKINKEYLPAEVLSDGKGVRVKVRFVDDEMGMDESAEDLYWSIDMQKERGKWKVTSMPVK